MPGRALLLLFAALACLILFQEVRMPEPDRNIPHADTIDIAKASHRLMLLSEGRIIRTYQVALGSGAVGEPKRREGDRRTPEGEYVINGVNTQSHYHLALHVSYPNALDIAQAKASGVNPGGDIMIHGLGHGLGWLGPWQHHVDWTAGCIAVSNAEIEEIAAAAPPGTKVVIHQ